METKTFRVEYLPGSFLVSICQVIRHNDEFYYVLVLSGHMEGMTTTFHKSQLVEG